MKFASVNRVGESDVEDLIAFMNEVFPEKNARINKFRVSEFFQKMHLKLKLYLNSKMNIAIIKPV